MSLDLDAIEHEADRLGGLVDSATVLDLVAEVRALRARLALYDPHAPIPDDTSPTIAP